MQQAFFNVFRHFKTFLLISHVFITMLENIAILIKVSNGSNKQNLIYGPKFLVSSRFNRPNHK